MAITVTASHTINVPRSKLWEVLADFPNVANWSAGIKSSWSPSGGEAEVGATRVCELSPAGRLDETLREFVPEEKMVVSIDKTRFLPVKSAVTTFILTEQGEGVTLARSVSQIEPKGFGIIANLLGRRMQTRLSKAAQTVLEELGAEAEK